MLLLATGVRIHALWSADSIAIVDSQMLLTRARHSAETQSMLETKLATTATLSMVTDAAAFAGRKQVICA